MSTAQASSEFTGVSVVFAGVSKVFGSTRALDGLDLDIEPGELVALLGPSGCGKTTALRILAGFEDASSGSVLVGGRDISRQPPNRRDMGMVFQSYSLFPTMTAVDNVAFGLRLRRRAPAQRRRRAEELLDLVGLSPHARKYPHQLSGGQQQRVALARALAVTPRVLLLDEPLSALDAKVREQLREEIRTIQLELGVTTLFVTHDQEEALSLADRVGVMREGKLEQVAAPAALYDRPATAFVASFVGTTNELPAVMETSGRVRVGRQLLPVDGDAPPAGASVSALARPEAVVVEPDPNGDAVITVATFRGAMTRLRVTLGGSAEIVADVPSHRAGELAAGTRVAVSLLERAVLVRASD